MVQVRGGLVSCGLCIAAHRVTCTVYGREVARLGCGVGKIGPANTICPGCKVVWALRFTSGLSKLPLVNCVQVGPK
jgi:hypothetical protein